MKEEKKSSTLPNVLVAFFAVTAIAGATVAAFLWNQMSTMKSRTIPDAVRTLDELRQEAAEIGQLVDELPREVRGAGNIEQDLHAFAAQSNFRLTGVTPRIVDHQDFTERQVAISIQTISRKQMKDFLTLIQHRRMDAKVTTITCSFDDAKPYDIKSANITVVTFENKK